MSAGALAAWFWSTRYRESRRVFIGENARCLGIDSMDRRDWWRASADAQLSLLESAKDKLRETRQQLDISFPSWRAAYTTNPTDYRHHDARREFFVGLQMILGNAQLTYTFMRDQLCDEDWWVAKAGKYRSGMVEQSLREQALMVKFFTVHAIAMTTEETLRAIVRAGGPFSCPSTAEFASVVAHVLKVTELQHLDPLFQLIRLVRNTIHNNGVHRPKSGKNETVTYGSRTFQFVAGQELSWMGEEFLSWLPEQLNGAMREIVESAPVSSLAACPRLA